MNIKNVIEFYFIINKSNLFIQIKLIIVINDKIILSFTCNEANSNIIPKTQIIVEGS